MIRNRFGRVPLRRRGRSIRRRSIGRIRKATVSIDDIWDNDDLMGSVSATARAIIEAAEIPGDEDDKVDTLRYLMDEVHPPVINYIDALDMLYDAIEEVDENGELSDNYAEMLYENIDEYMTLHWGRPGECGSDCPAFYEP